MKLSKKEHSFGLKVTRVHFGLFDYAVYIVTGKYKYVENYIRWKHRDKKYNLEKHPCGSLGLTFHKPGYVPVIWLPKKPKTPEEIATLSHECLHVVQELFRWTGLQMVFETDEVAAHALSYLVKKILLKNK